MSANNQSPSLLQRKSDEVEAARVGVGGQTVAGVTKEQLPELGAPTTGVVFVHGIGEQVRAEILLGWSRPIVRAIADWSRSLSDRVEGPVPSSGDRVVRTGIDFEGSDLPLVTVGVPGTTVDGVRHDPQTWVMTEARWAQDVQPPSLETMIDWCGPRGVVATVVNRIVERSMAGDRVEAPVEPRDADPRSAAAGSRRDDAVRALAEMGLSAFVSVVVTFGLLMYAVVRTVAGIIPYKPLQDAIGRFSLDTFLTTWWGDVYVLLDDPVQAANIRGQVAKSIRALRAFGCERIVLVAHSGGTIVSYMTLADPALGERVDTLITHGQAIQMGRNIWGTEGRDPTSSGGRIETGTPLATTRWRDFHATHDPAPAGQLDEATPGRVPPGVTFVDDEVWNRMSIAEDHGAYFDNDEEFVERVLAEIELAGRTGVGSRFRPGWDGRLLRHRQRVFVLTLWRRLMFVIPTIAIAAAFLTPSQGLIPVLRDVAATIATAIPYAKDVFGFLASTFPPPGPDWAITGAATIFAVLFGLAIIQAALPIGRLSIWDGWRKRVFRLLDTGVALIGLLVVLLIWKSPTGSTSAAVGGLVNRFGDAPLRNAVIVLAAVFVVLWIPQLRAGLAAVGTRFLLVTRLIVILGALAILSIATYGVIVDAGIRMVVSASVVGFGMFQILGRVGAWRWARWDEAERAIARERRTTLFRRRYVWLEFLPLGGIAAVAALGIVLANADLVRGAGVALGILIAIEIVADVVFRKTAAPVTGRPTAASSQAGAPTAARAGAPPTPPTPPTPPEDTERATGDA